MYNDEGSTGIVWENNLVHDTQSAGYHQHYGRGNIVRNNIIAFGAEEHVRYCRPEDFFAFAFERNIVLLGEGRLFMHVDKNWDNGRVFLNDNVYWKPGGEIAEFAGNTWAELAVPRPRHDERGRRSTLRRAGERRLDAEARIARAEARLQTVRLEDKRA